MPLTETDRWPMMGRGLLIGALLCLAGAAGAAPPAVTTQPPEVGVPAWNKVTFSAFVNPNGQATTVRFFVSTDGAAPQEYVADTLRADANLHIVTLVAPFDLDLSHRYTVRAAADYQGGYDYGDDVRYYFSPMTQNAGAALRFEAGKSLSTGDMGLSAGAAPFTVEGWVNLVSLPASDTEILRLGSPTQPSLTWTLHPDATLTVSMAGAVSLTPTVPLRTGTWYHIATTFDGTGMALYEQGAPVAAATVAAHPVLRQLFLGGHNPGSFAFSMDEVRVWNVARTQTDLQRDGARVGPIAADGLLADYHLDEATGITVRTSNRDLYGLLSDGAMWEPSTAPLGVPLADATYATHVTRTGATLNGVVDPMGLVTTVQMGWGLSGPNNIAPADPPVIDGVSSSTPVSAHVTGLAPGRIYAFRPLAANPATASLPNGVAERAIGYFATPDGPAGTALNFAGRGDALRVPSFGQNAFKKGITIQFWQKVAEAREQSAIVLAPDDSHNRINVHSPWSDGSVYFDFGDSAWSGRLAYTPPESIVGTWQQFTCVAVTASGDLSGGMQIYRNGVLEASRAGAGTYSPQAADLSIGGLPAGSFKGLLDEVRIWNRPLTTNEVQANWNTTLHGDEPGLVLYLPMDDASGSRAADLSGHGNDGVFWSNGANGGRQPFNPYGWEDPLWDIAGWPVRSTGLPDAAMVLRMAGGFRTATPEDMVRYSADGVSITLSDALNAARAAPGP